MHPPARRQETLPVMVAVILCTLLHLPNISAAAAGLCLAMWGYHLCGLGRPLPLPGLTAKTAAGLLLFFVAVLTNEGLTIEAFVALLALMISLKLFELRHQRDKMITIILCYFVIVSAMFFSDSLVATLFIAATVLYNTAVLIHVQQPCIRIIPALRLAGRLALQALPFTLLVFLLFPRIQGGLWGRPSLIAAKSGFTEEITLGRIASLALNRDVAFRVHFDASLPAREQLYWRGIVLSRFDGATWRRGGTGRAGNSLVPAADDSSVRYTLTLEPHNRPWLFALDLPTRAAMRGVWLTSDHTLHSWRPIASRISYQAVSRPEARLIAEDRAAAEALQLPEAGNDKARRLAQQWREASSSDREVIDRALAFFNASRFRYTLSPAAAGHGQLDAADAIDHFLFASRAGFCEHYAASLAFLLRAAGVPARLVGGYLGGQLNPIGDYLVVRQADAHVWCEALVEGSWARLDPTAVVAPQRLLAGPDDLVAAGESANLLSLLGMDRLAHWLQPLSNLWDMVNNRWNQWVMAYSFADQVRLFSFVGIDLQLSKGVMQAVLFGFVLLAAAAFLLLALFRPPTANHDPVARDWLLFCRKLERIGLVRQPHQGPIAFLETIEARRPDLATQVRPLFALYIGLRYREHPEEQARHAFREAVRRLSLVR